MTLRVMTYNILNGGTGREQLIFEVLKMVNPDVILLEEVMDFRIVESLAESLNMLSFFAKGNSIRHLAILSRYPIVFQHSYHPFPLRTTLLEATIECASKQYIHLFGVHLNAHYFILNELRRIMEIKTILKRITEYRKHPCLIAGDFNAVANNDHVNIEALPSHLKAMIFLQGNHIFRHALSKLSSAGFIDCYRQLHRFDQGFTLPTPSPHVRLDYVFADRYLIKYLLECDVVTESPILHRASDHYPLVAEFDF